MAGVAAVLAILFTAPPATAEPSYWTWFKHTEATSADWSITGVEGDNLRVEIRRKGINTNRPLWRVFVLFPRPSSAYDTAMEQILEVFAEKNINAQFSLYNFNRDEVRAVKALRLAESGGHALIFSMGSESTAWLYKNYLGGGLPVVSVCSKDPVQLGQAADYVTGSGANFAFTSLNMPVEAQMSYVLQLKPNLKNIGVLVDSKNVSAVQTQAEPIADWVRQRGIRVLNLAVEDPKNAQQELALMVPEAVADMKKNDPNLDNSVFWITGSTSVFNEIVTINANSDRVPVLSVVPDVVKAGDDSAVLSVGISFESNAHLAALYGIDVLSGKAAVGDLPVGIVSPPDIAINFRKAREIGLQVPFSFFESASVVYDYEGRLVRSNGKPVEPTN